MILLAQLAGFDAAAAFVELSVPPDDEHAASETASPLAAKTATRVLVLFTDFPVD
jgi:hypothetical protein